MIAKISRILRSRGTSSLNLNSGVLLAGMIVAVGTSPSESFGQSLLERIEKRLNAATNAATQGEKEAKPAKGAGELPPPKPAQTDKVAENERGTLGISGTDKGEAKGVFITKVENPGPGTEAGLRVGDRIVAIDGKKIQTLDDLAGATMAKKAGVVVVIGYERDGKNQTKSLVLGRNGALPLPPAPALPNKTGNSAPASTGTLPAPAGQPAPSRGLPTRGLPTRAQRPALGVMVNPVNSETRFRYALNARQGAVITSIVPASPAARHGLPIGGVIVEFGKIEINSPDDLVAALGGAKVGDEVELAYYHGPQLYRKKVTLTPAGSSRAIPGSLPAPQTPQPAPPSVADRLRGLQSRSPLNGRDGGVADRPLVRRLEGLIDRLGDGGVLPPAAAPPAVPPQNNAPSLQQQILAMQETIRRLEQRVAQLEQQLNQQPKNNE